MDNKFRKIEDFVDSLEESALLSEGQSLLLIGGNGNARTTAVNYWCDNSRVQCQGHNEGCSGGN